jgi:hypothetical protein
LDVLGMTLRLAQGGDRATDYLEGELRQSRPLASLWRTRWR